MFPPSTVGPEVSRSVNDGGKQPNREVNDGLVRMTGQSSGVVTTRRAHFACIPLHFSIHLQSHDESQILLRVNRRLLMSRLQQLLARR